ncbi:hypothetical protein TNCV_3554691 [Trichonephila clavipes]|nr:hypothetical protein TNCV_3554691 [Trichonephila clavipes]
MVDFDPGPPSEPLEKFLCARLEGKKRKNMQKHFVKKSDRISRLRDDSSISSYESVHSDGSFVMDIMKNRKIKTLKCLFLTENFEDQRGETWVKCFRCFLRVHLEQGWRTIGTRAIDDTRHNILGTPLIKTINRD